jgi:hypothetical protein
MTLTETILRIVDHELEAYLVDDVRQRVIIMITGQLQNRCGHVMTRGKNVGGACNRRCPGELYCKTHARVYNSLEDEDIYFCQHVLTRGRHKGTHCKRQTTERYCKFHKNRHPESPIERREQNVLYVNTGYVEPTEADFIPTEEVVYPEQQVDKQQVDKQQVDEQQVDEQQVDEQQVDEQQVDEQQVDEQTPEEQVDEQTPEEQVDEKQVDIRSRTVYYDETPYFKMMFTPRPETKYSDCIPVFPVVDRESSTTPYIEYGSDSDAKIDESDLTEIYSVRRDWGCQYWVDKLNDFCQGTTVIGGQFCATHKRNYGKVPYKLDMHSYPLLEINSVYHKNHMFTGQIWYPRLLLGAKITSEGLVVIGRIMGNRWFKALTRREIKRCQNNGLLYKVLPQEIIHYNYHIPDPDTLMGEGFTSFDQIRWKRPKLYIKYWNIWNRHIQQRKAFIQTNQHQTDANKWRKDHNCKLPNWAEVKQEHAQHGWENIVVPAPTIDQLADVNFDPWVYCDDWVETHHKGKKTAPHFPPMYLDYPNPEQMRFRPYNQNNGWNEYEVKLDTPRRTKHYMRKPEHWLEHITTDGKEWLEIIC